MSVFIRHVTVWSRAPSDRYLYTPLHIMEPAPSVLNFSLSSLLQTVAESVSVQFVDHLKWCFPAFRQCSISSSQRRSCAPVFRRPLGCLSRVRSSPFIHLNFTPFSVCLQLNSRCKSTLRTAACLHILFLSVFIFFFFFFHKKQGQATMGSFQSCRIIVKILWAIKNGWISTKGVPDFTEIWTSLL